MSYEPKHRGFSLTEVLMAMGVLAIGMVFVAGIFPVGLHFATVSTEQTIAAVAADEAFAKIRLYAEEGEPSVSDDGFDPNRLQDRFEQVNGLVDFNDTYVFPALAEADPCEFTYPSNDTKLSQRRYCWLALCRLTSEHDDVNNPNPAVQVTVFVCRKTGSSLKYYDTDSSGKAAQGGTKLDWPRPVKVDVSPVPGKLDELKITNQQEKIFINDGCAIVDNKSGRIYRVLERYAPKPAGYDQIILLSRDWDDTSVGPAAVWVIPPAVNGGRGPCIAVYQKVIRF